METSVTYPLLISWLLTRPTSSTDTPHYRNEVEDQVKRNRYWIISTVILDGGCFFVWPLHQRIVLRRQNHSQNYVKIIAVKVFQPLRLKHLHCDDLHIILITIQLSNTKVFKYIIRSRVSSFSLSIFVCWLNFVCSLISRCDSCQFLRVNFNFQDVNSAVQKDRCTLVAVSCYGIRGFCWPKLWLSTFAHTQIPPRTPLKRNIFSTQFSQGEQTIRFCSIL